MCIKNILNYTQQTNLMFLNVNNIKNQEITYVYVYVYAAYN